MKGKNMHDSYQPIFVILAVCGAYFISWLAVIANKITLLTHRRIWNALLAITALVSCLFGLFLAIIIDHKMQISWYGELLWYHVEFGIAMTVISVFHFVWHWQYYLAMIKQIKKK